MKLTNEMSELKACPICGSEAFKTVETVEGFDDFADYDIATVECHNPNCRLQMQDADNSHSDEINKRWNTRPFEDALTAKISRLIEVGDKRYVRKPNYKTRLQTKKV